MRAGQKLAVHSCIALVGLGSMSTAAFAQTWNEIGPGFGAPAQPDAGPLTTDPNVNITSGAGALTTINGHMLNGADADLYCIRISNPSAFSATTTGADPGHNLALALFDAAGNGVVANYDLSAGDINASLTNALVTTPGVYYLMVYGEIIRYPAGAGGFIWTPPPSPATGLVGQLAPNPLAGPLTSFAFDFARGFSSNITQVPYSVSLTGVEYHLVPAPGMLGLVGVAGVIGGIRRRR